MLILFLYQVFDRRSLFFYFPSQHFFNLLFVVLCPPFRCNHLTWQFLCFSLVHFIWTGSNKQTTVGIRNNIKNEEGNFFQGSVAKEGSVMFLCQMGKVEMFKYCEVTHICVYFHNESNILLLYKMCSLCSPIPPMTTVM